MPCCCNQSLVNFLALLSRVIRVGCGRGVDHGYVHGVGTQQWEQQNELNTGPCSIQFHLLGSSSNRPCCRCREESDQSEQNPTSHLAPARSALPLELESHPTPPLQAEVATELYKPSHAPSFEAPQKFSGSRLQCSESLRTPKYSSLNTCLNWHKVTRLFRLLCWSMFLTAVH